MSYHYVKAEEYSMIEYARHLKMGGDLENYGSAYRHKFTKLSNKHIDISNFHIGKTEFSKYLPINHNQNYLLVFKTKKHYEKVLSGLKERVILVQILLLFIFAIISYFLAKNALKPMKDSISKLDKFAKDLIHDLNTPLTSIKLNMKILERVEGVKNHKAASRLSKSVYDISELHDNLKILLEEETFQIELINICDIVYDVVQTHKQIYPDIHFLQECENFKIRTNQNAIRQILQNIISNACKYNVENGFVRTYVKDATLYIEDSGKGIKEPERIFDRSYSGEHSSGIGLDIVKRLALAMNLKIDVSTSSKGSCFSVTFR
jgi:two-component system OmpR family sensor kinase